MKAEFEAWAWKYFVVKNSFAEAAWDEAYQAGALAMRERAAKVNEEYHYESGGSCKDAAAAIRALPVEE